jgi:large subunit ribosomal protein L27
MFTIFKKPVFIYQQFFKSFATKMRAGVTKNTKDSPGKRLGVKKFGGEEVLQNQIIVKK